MNEISLENNDAKCYNTLMNKKLMYQLGEYRLKHQLTQITLAERLKVSRITLYRWLNGASDPRPLELHRIKELLKGTQ